jgi:hypothetical protein
MTVEICNKSAVTDRRYKITLGTIKKYHWKNLEDENLTRQKNIYERTNISMGSRL